MKHADLEELFSAELEELFSADLEELCGSRGVVRI